MDPHPESHTHYMSYVSKGPRLPMPGEKGKGPNQRPALRTYEHRDFSAEDEGLNAQQGVLVAVGSLGDVKLL